MTTVLLIALVLKVIDFLRLLTNFKVQKSAILTQLAAWAGGVGLTAVAAHAAITANLVLPGTGVPVHGLDFGSILLAGMMLSSAASASVDFKQAFDNNDSASKPPLLPSNGAGAPGNP